MNKKALLVGLAIGALLFTQKVNANDWWDKPFTGGSPSTTPTTPTYIDPTIPGTSLRDYNSPGYKVEGNTIFPTIPGTHMRDYNKPGYKWSN